jgi:ankyrin repeat protein
LHYEAGEGHKEIIELLIANGADVEVKTPSQNTALDLAVNRAIISNTPKPPTSSANTAARRVKNLKLKANETNTTHNNRSRSAGGVFHRTSC